MGIRPAEGWSVDRINPKKGYLVGNVRWADKLTQTQNRRVTKWHTLPDGRQVNVTQLAKMLGMKPDTLRKALKRGATAEEIMTRNGVRLSAEYSWRFPPKLHALLEAEYRSDGKAGMSRLAWFCQRMPKLIEDLRGQGKTWRECQPLEELLGEAKAELDNIRKAKKVEKSKLAFAVLQAFSGGIPLGGGNLAQKRESPTPGSGYRHPQPPEDEAQDLSEDHPAFGIVAMANKAVSDTLTLRARRRKSGSMTSSILN